MERERWRSLSREQLIELVLALAAEVAELKAQLGQPPKTPGNSSVPPSVGFKANRAERRARKRRRGHDGISRRRQQPDVIVRCRPTTCQGCGEPLPLAGQRRVGPEPGGRAAPDPTGGGRGVAVRRAVSAGVGTGPRAPTRPGWSRRGRSGRRSRRCWGTSTSGTTSATSGWSRSVGTSSASRSARAGSTRRSDGWPSGRGRPTRRSARQVRAGSGDRLGRDRSASGRQDRLAVGVPDARGQLSRHRAPAERRGDRGLPGRRRVPRAGSRTCGAPSSRSTPRPTRSAWRTRSAT